MAECNFCSLQYFKIVANNAGGEVILVPKPEPGLAPDGVDVFIHYPKDPVPSWCAWFMKLSDRCVCWE
jgi:hypothetical protein